MSYSFTGEFIIEEFIEKNGDSSDTECFSVNGELVFASFNNQKFDVNADNPYAPCAFTWPCEMSQDSQDLLRSELQRLMRLLKLNTSIYNVETREGTNGKPYIMECTPRGGGNRLAEVLEFATGTELIKNAVRAAVGDPVGPMTDPVYDGYWAEIILHSEKDGVFKELIADNSVKDHLYQTDLWVEPGDEVHKFSAANFSIGTLVLRFDDKNEMNDLVNHIYEHVKVVVN
ncbi:hypothetical protein [Clostridium sp. AM58-1XD]|uniref:hypothetical protein n=1 Tax=Clostridium sp. AM58-1XD TaxID=2292307 RepID=UPI001A9A6E82|nr:hypothetical protein [Clostridium sp. AM58-1XD]